MEKRPGSILSVVAIGIQYDNHRAPENEDKASESSPRCRSRKRPSNKHNQPEAFSGFPLSPRPPVAAAAAKSLQSCPTLCDPRDGSPPGSPVPGILQARVPEGGAIAFSISQG